MYFFLLAYTILGAGIKYIDDAFDENRFSKKIAFAIAPVLGVLGSYSMLIDKVSATILLAILFGVLIKGKIDNRAHILGFISAMAVILIVGVELMILPLIFLASLALLDEVGNDVIDYNKKFLNMNGFLSQFVRYFFDQRWLLKIGILCLVILGVIPIFFFLAILLFDYAYFLVHWYGDSKPRVSRVFFSPTRS